MQTIIVKPQYVGMRTDAVLRTVFSELSSSSLYKAFRKKNIKINGKKANFDHILSNGDEISLYLPDNILDGSIRDENIDIIYEDEQVIIVNKAQGQSVHPDKYQTRSSLVNAIKRRLNAEDIFLCHRIDRNTGGLVLLAKGKRARDFMLTKISCGEIKKYYMCFVKGEMKTNKGTLKAYLKKDAFKSRVFISDHEERGYVPIVTNYVVLGVHKFADRIVTKLGVELVSGRTHQIRAHLAHIGHPIVGDGKYGDNRLNRLLGIKYQQLWSSKIVFDFKNMVRSGHLAGKIFEVKPKFSLEKVNYK